MAAFFNKVFNVELDPSNKVLLTLRCFFWCSALPLTEILQRKSVSPFVLFLIHHIFMIIWMSLYLTPSIFLAKFLSSFMNSGGMPPLFLFLRNQTPLIKCPGDLITGCPANGHVYLVLVWSLPSLGIFGPLRFDFNLRCWCLPFQRRVT